MGFVRFVVIARLKSRLIFDRLLCPFVSLCAAWLVNGGLIAVVNDDGISTVDCDTNAKQLHVSMHEDMTLYMTISSSSRFGVLHCLNIAVGR